MKKKLLFLRGFNKDDFKFLKSALQDKWDFIIPENFNETTLLDNAYEADAFLGYNVSKRLIKSAPNLKVVQVPGAGVNLLDLDAFKSTDVKLCNSHSNSLYVAEFAVSLLHALNKKICIHDSLMREGEWFRYTGTDSDKFFLSDTVWRKKVGFLGFGNIGQRIGSLLSPYEIEMLVVRKDSSKEIQHDELSDYVRVSNLNHMLEHSDIVFITLPLTEETRDLIDENAFNKMKSSAYLINVGRGEVVNEEALYFALKGNKIRGAAIDVWYPKSDKNNNFPSESFNFHKLKNIVLSPYRAGYLGDTSPHLFDVVDNLNRLADGKPLMNVVNVSKGY